MMDVLASSAAATSESFPGGVFRMNFDMKPGQYVYEETSYGKSAYGVVQNGAQSERDPYAQRTAGHDERQAHDQGGHLIPHSQGGRNDQTNLVAQDANVNQIDVRDIERTNSELANDPQNTVYYEVNAYTKPGNERPDAFMITSAVRNNETGQLDVQHSSFTNASHEEQDEWNSLCDQYATIDPHQVIGLSPEERELANEYAEVDVSEELGSAYSYSSTQGENEAISNGYSMDYTDGLSM